MSIKRWHAYIEDDDGNDLFVSHQQDAQGQWVRYDDHAAEVERLQARERELETALRDVVANARETPDYTREGVTDCYVLTLDDFDAARAALAAVSAETAAASTDWQKIAKRGWEREAAYREKVDVLTAALAAVSAETEDDDA